jgi:hypothetical protein
LRHASQPCDGDLTQEDKPLDVVDEIVVALTHPFTGLAGQRSWTEIPFGTLDADERGLPWDRARLVEIPGTGIRIEGYIDRLDLAGDLKRARVIDYKTGRLTRNMSDVVVKGGNELQRCLYAFAVKSLLGADVKVETALLYPGVAEGDQVLFPLKDVDTVLDRLADAVMLARRSLLSGAALPDVDANDQFNDFAFAYPASPIYLPRKMPSAKEQLGEAAKIWDEP